MELQNTRFLAGTLSTTLAGSEAKMSFPTGIGTVAKLRLLHNSTTLIVYVKFKTYGEGAAGAAVTTTNTTLADTRQSWITNEWVGSIVTCNAKTMTVTSNTATTLTGASWSGGGNPGNGNAWTLDGKAAVPAAGDNNAVYIPAVATGSLSQALEIEGNPLYPTSSASSTYRISAIASGAGPTTVYYQLWYRS
jgi:hypothetical protein